MFKKGRINQKSRSRSGEIEESFAIHTPKLKQSPLPIQSNTNLIAWSNSNTNRRNMRKILATQVLSNTNLIAGQGFRTYKVRRLVKDVYSKLGRKININEIAFKTEVKVVTSMLWGCSKSGDGDDSSSIGDGFREVEFKIVQLMAAPNISDFLPMRSWFDPHGRQQEMKKQLEYADQIFENIIQGRIEVNSKKIEGEAEVDGRKDFLQILLDLKDQKDTPVSLNIIQIKVVLMDIVLAVTDTTSTMVEWVMAKNGKEPKLVIQKILFASNLKVNQNRLNLPINQLETIDFLTEIEKRDLKKGMELQVPLLLLQLW